MNKHIRRCRMYGIVLTKNIYVALDRLAAKPSRDATFPLIVLVCLGLGSWNIAGAQVQPAAPVIHFDTIYASTSMTTTMIFPARISIYDIGSEDFGGMKEDNLLLLKAAHAGATPTSLLIKYGDDIYHGTLAYRLVPPERFIDFSKMAPANIPQLPNEARVSKDDSLKSLNEKIAGKRLNMMLSDSKSYYKNNAVKDAKERIVLTLTDLRTDEKNVYLKLLLINESKLDYHIDFVEFIYQNPMEQKEMKGAYDKKNVYQNVSNNIDLIGAKDQRYIGYSIPRYTLGKKGELLIVVREKNGSRAISLPLPFTLILEAKTINQ